MAKFKVLKPHIGDKFYQVDDTRTLMASDAKHLVENGTLQLMDAEEVSDDNDSQPKEIVSPDQMKKPELQQWLSDKGIEYDASATVPVLKNQVKAAIAEADTPQD